MPCFQYLATELLKSIHKHVFYSCIVIILLSSLNVCTINSLSILSDHQLNITTIDCDSKNYNLTSVNHAIIKPLVVLKESSIPLTNDIGCPNILRIHFSGLNNDRFVIDLIKNKRLISDKYFQISKDNINRHGRHPDASARNIPPLKSSSQTNSHDDEQFSKNHLFVNLHNFTTNDDHCHYHGYVGDSLSSISAISIVNGNLLSGFFHDGQHIYYLHADTSKSYTILSKSINLCNNDHSNNTPFNSSNGQDRVQIKHRSRRETKSTKQAEHNYIMHEPFASNSSSLYIEILIVHDHSQYLEYKRNDTIIVERTMQIVNFMNAFYRQLNIYISLVGIVLWTERDEIELTEDGDATLTNFLKYRYEKLLPRYYHDNAQLITSTSFNGSVVGKALKGPICTHEHSGGVNTDHSHNSIVIAVTLAHELGHNLGMEHDEDDKCSCPDEKCLMSSSSNTVHPKYWSSCSIDYLEESKRHGLLDCLVKKPEKVYGPVCGNGFVEEGEDCDLGELLPTFGTSRSKSKSNCNDKQGYCGQQNVDAMNPCCDRKKCKFTKNATCAQGPCCNLFTCSVYNGTETKICRPRKTECDFEEICDGNSEYCPSDVYYHDGTECGPTTSLATIDLDINNNRGKAFCYEGKCSSHESQCQLLWGTNSVVSKDICYEQNIHGNSSGNCGYNREDKSFNGCEQEDAICGMLHCVHNQVPPSGQSSLKQISGAGKLLYGFESASILTVSFFVMNNNAKIYCNGAIIDAGQGMRDPGLVPNGAYCGNEKMCVNQRCASVHDILYKENWCPNDCNGNGICDNVGVCHCNDGTIGTSCYQFFSANFHLSLFLYIILFFLPIILVLVFAINHYKKQIKIWWFLHNRKIELKNKAREASLNSLKTRRILNYDKDQQKLTISDPIPLNQHNINRPFYEPNQSTINDPWAETNNQL